MNETLMISLVLVEVVTFTMGWGVGYYLGRRDKIIGVLPYDP